MTYEEAVRFCGYPSVEACRLSGLGQFTLLLKEGMKHESSVLEIGSGCFAAGKFVADYADGYLGIEPNEAVAGAVGYPVEHVSDFRSTAGVKFDYILSHSILSHASDSQLPQFMQAVKDQLEPGGVCLASFRMGTQDEHHEEWVYPDPRFFSLAQIGAAAEGLNWEVVEDYRKIMTLLQEEQYHDWLRITLCP